MSKKRHKHARSGLCCTCLSTRMFSAYIVIFPTVFPFLSKDIVGSISYPGVIGFAQFGIRYLKKHPI